MVKVTKQFSGGTPNHHLRMYIFAENLETLSFTFLLIEVVLRTGDFVSLPFFPR